MCRGSTCCSTQACMHDSVQVRCVTGSHTRWSVLMNTIRPYACRPLGTIPSGIRKVSIRDGARLEARCVGIPFWFLCLSWLPRIGAIHREPASVVTSHRAVNHPSKGAPAAAAAGCTVATSSRACGSRCCGRRVFEKIHPDEDGCVDQHSDHGHAARDRAIAAAAARVLLSITRAGGRRWLQGLVKLWRHRCRTSATTAARRVGFLADSTT